MLDSFEVYMCVDRSTKTTLFYTLFFDGCVIWINKTNNFPHITFERLNCDLLSESYFILFLKWLVFFLFANDYGSESHIEAFTRIEDF